MKRTILIVEDNEELAFGLQTNLEIEGYEVHVAADGNAGLESARTIRHDLLILDLMLPGMDGFRVLRVLRDEGMQTPVLILTARGEESDKVRGLKLGADDYVTKPFGILELLARVEALLRRAAAPAGARRLERFGDVTIDREARIVFRDGEPVSLKPKEFDLLVALYERRERAVSRLELVRDVWGYSDSVITRTIDTHVAELRRKLENDPRRPAHILTVQRFGYRLVREPLTNS